MSTGLVRGEYAFLLKKGVLTAHRFLSHRTVGANEVQMQVGNK
jgi:hypothetical protein